MVGKPENGDKQKPGSNPLPNNSIIEKGAEPKIKAGEAGAQTTKPPVISGVAKPEKIREILGKEEPSVDTLAVTEKFERNLSLPGFDIPTAEPKKRGRKPKSHYAEQSRESLLLMLNGLVEVLLGPEARMNEVEMVMMEDPLQRILERQGSSTIQMLEKYTDPIILLTGMVLWGGRVTQIRKIQVANRPKTGSGRSPGQAEMVKDDQTPVEVPLYSKKDSEVYSAMSGAKILETP